MTSETKEAKSFLSDAEESAGTAAGVEFNNLAQTHALIAIAEQLRIANVLTLASCELFEGYDGATEVIYDTSDSAHWKLQPDTAKALGIEES